jgi:Restriction endonuclease
MTGYTPTHIGIPKNHADFERKSVVLFQGLLGDPSVKRLGRSGQKQYGIDLLGYRNGDSKKLVGIQCKKKQPNKALTATEVRTEVRKALKYRPPLSEYIIITTASDDTNGDRTAYYREAATIATRFAFSIPLGAALEMRKVLETMKCRDPRLAASFGRAEAVLEASLFAA